MPHPRDDTDRPDDRPATTALELLVVIVCYRAADLTIDCLRSLRPQIAAIPGARVTVCENGTGPESVKILAEAIDAEGWSDWVRLEVIEPNRGFTGGNNVILRDAMAWNKPPRFMLLLNADTIVRPGALEALLAAADHHPEAGIISPRLEWPDGTPQESCFHDFAPVQELLSAARTRWVDKLFKSNLGAMEVSDAPVEVDWTSFACTLIRREVFAQVGLLDEGYFLYFDDSDYCRTARQAGWQVLHRPEARVIHLRGKSNPLKSLTARGKRRPRYWYHSRARYYAKHHGRVGLWAANLFWTIGRSISLARELVGGKPPHTCEREWRDIWTNVFDPLRRPDRPEGDRS